MKCFSQIHEQTLKDEFKLTPFEKFRKFRKFPLKLFFHLSLIVLCILCSFLSNEDVYTHVQTMHEDVLNWMLPPTLEEKDGSKSKLEFYIYTPHELENHLEHVFKTYSIMPNISSTFVEVSPQISSTASSDSSSSNQDSRTSNYTVPFPTVEIINWLHAPPTPTLQVLDEGNIRTLLSSVNNREIGSITIKDILNNHLWREQVLGADQNISRLLKTLKTLQLTFYFNMCYTKSFQEELTVSDRCCLWKIQFLYDYTYRAQMRVNVQYSTSRLPDEDNRSPVFVEILCGLILVLTCLYTLLLLKSIYQAIDIIRRLNNKEVLLWEDITWEQFTILFNLWNINAIIANLIIIDFVFNVFFENLESPSSSGLAGGLHVLSLIQYLRYDARNYFVISIISKSILPLASVILQILPIYMGAVVFSTSTFGVHSERFGFLGTSFVTLFSLLNGDEMKDTMHDAAKSRETYVFTTILFLCVFVTVCT
jgi:hypothetical protein